MNKIPFFLSALFLFAMVSCTPKQKETNQTQSQYQEQQIKELVEDTSSVNPVLSSEKEVPEQTSTAVVLNPPHGQPGHLCEIPVGSPLPSSSAKTTPETKKIETAPKKVETTQRLNPAHGEPGHRCEIPVGAPLDTPAPTSTPPATSSGSFTPTVENAARIKPGQR